MRLAAVKGLVRFSALAGLLLVATLVVGIDGWYSLWTSNSDTTEAMRKENELELSIDAARIAQVDFKKQVQEWKDILLRGDDPASFDKYYQSFIKQSAATNDDLRKLNDILGQLGLETPLIAQALKVHEALDARYLNALKQYDRSNPDSAFVVDRLVKGMDRPLTNQIDEIVVYVKEQSARLTLDAGRKAKASYRLSSLLLLAVAILAIALGSAITYWLRMELVRRYVESIELHNKLSQAQQQLLQSEKLASIGQLAAGLAHEINNPIGYVSSGLGTLEGYLAKLFELLAAYEKIEPHLGTSSAASDVTDVRKRVEIDYLKADILDLMRECKEGITRVRGIVQDLKDFSRVDSNQEWQRVDLHQGLDSTLNIAHNEIKYKAKVIKEYGNIPEVECLPSQINQVVLNLLVNAAHAIKENGKITVRTGNDDDSVWIEVKDTGCGIPPENLSRIFDPFFTSKPVGQGTGLGLALSYGIIQKHHGHISVQSVVGKGTTFRVTLPAMHDRSRSDNAEQHEEI